MNREGVGDVRGVIKIWEETYEGKMRKLYLGEKKVLFKLQRGSSTT